MKIRRDVGVEIELIESDRAKRAVGTEYSREQQQTCICTRVCAAVLEPCLNFFCRYTACADE